MLKINKKLSKKGFSLIELMVAVVILALAIFGIFQAYSTGFMGMADARDRTVATNYAREAMEDIKNKDFDQIITQSRNYIDGTKYEREVIVQPSTNLKKVTTKVYWKDRNDNTKMVETDMVIHFIETTAGTPTKIILYANPYNVLTENISDPGNTIDERKSTITAVVKDAKGNTVTAGSINISFSITTGSTLGSISSESEISVEGKATTIFTASSKGEVIITASANGLTDNSVAIEITNPNTPVKINLTASPIFMTPGSVSIITATIVNAGGATVTEEIEQVEITFSVSGPGDLSNQTNNPTVSGETMITLTSNATPGTITVTASSIGLEPGIINVYTGGLIYLSASSINVPVKETSEITVTTKDVDGVPINYKGTINLSIESSGGEGVLSAYSVNFGGTTSSETVIFTASSAGAVKITANDPTPTILTPEPENELILTVIPELNPDHIKVDADPSSIPVGGNDTSTITARVEDEYYTHINSYTADITFTTTAGSFYSDKVETTITLINGIDDYKNGVATVKLYSSDKSETADISVTSVYYGETISGNTRVGFYCPADHIDLIAIPQSILTGGGSEGTCTLIATIKNGAIVVSGYNGTVTFTIEEGYPNGVKFTSTNQGSITISVVDGKAQIDLESKNWVGTAKISATADGISEIPTVDLDIPVVTNKNLEIFMLYKNTSNDEFMEYNNPADGSFEGEWIPGNISYGKFCVDNDNNLYILDLIGNCLQKKSSRGESLLRSDEIVKIEDRYNIYDSYAINIGPNGYIYFSQDVGTVEGIPEYCINKINPNTLLVEGILNLTPSVAYGGLAIDSNGDIYIHKLSDPTQTIEKWNFTEGLSSSPPYALSDNYDNSELAIAGNYIGVIGEVEVEAVSERKAFIIPKDFSSIEPKIEFTLSENSKPFYISSIGGDFLFSGLVDVSNYIIFGRYGVDGSIKWFEPQIIDGNQYSDCIIGAYPF